MIAAQPLEVTKYDCKNMHSIYQYMKTSPSLGTQCVDHYLIISLSLSDVPHSPLMTPHYICYEQGRTHSLYCPLILRTNYLTSDVKSALGLARLIIRYLIVMLG